MEKKTQFSIWYLALAIFAMVFLDDVGVGARSTAPIPYSEFQTLLLEEPIATGAVASRVS